MLLTIYQQAIAKLVYINRGLVSHAQFVHSFTLIRFGVDFLPHLADVETVSGILLLLAYKLHVWLI